MSCKIVGGTKSPGNESSSERKVQGTKVPRKNEKSREWKFLIGTICSWERKVLGTKSPGTEACTRLVPRVVYKTRDSLDPRHFGTSAKLSVRHVGTGAEVSRHISTDVLWKTVLTRRETRWNYLGCPKLTKRSQPLVGRSSPYCGDM